MITPLQEMLSDFNALRRAIRAHDTEATEEAWENCERWIFCLSPEPAEQKEVA